MFIERIERYIVDHYVSFETEETQKNTRIIDRLIHHIFGISVKLQYSLDEATKETCKKFTARMIHTQFLVGIEKSAHYSAFVALLSLAVLNIPWIVTGVKVLLASLTLFHFISASSCLSLLQNTPPSFCSKEGMILLGMIGFAVAIGNVFKNKVRIENGSLFLDIQAFLKKYREAHPDHDLGMSIMTPYPIVRRWINKIRIVTRWIDKILKIVPSYSLSIYSLDSSRKMFPVSALISPSKVSDLGELNSLPQEILVEIFKSTITPGMENYRHLTLTSKKIREVLHQGTPFWEKVCRFFVIEKDPTRFGSSLEGLQAAVVTQFSLWNSYNVRLRSIHMQMMGSLRKNALTKKKFRALPNFKISLGTSCLYNAVIEGRPLIWFCKEMGEEIDRQSLQENSFKGRFYYSSGVHGIFSLSRDPNKQQISIIIPMHETQVEMKKDAGRWWVSNGQTKVLLV